MRISFVEPDKAKEEAEKAVADGVMTDNDDNAMMDVATASPNGLKPNVALGWIQDECFNGKLPGGI